MIHLEKLQRKQQLKNILKISDEDMILMGPFLDYALNKALFTICNYCNIEEEEFPKNLEYILLELSKNVFLSFENTNVADYKIKRGDTEIMVKSDKSHVFLKCIPELNRYRKLVKYKEEHLL